MFATFFSWGSCRITLSWVVSYIWLPPLWLFPAGSSSSLSFFFFFSDICWDVIYDSMLLIWHFLMGQLRPVGRQWLYSLIGADGEQGHHLEHQTGLGESAWCRAGAERGSARWEAGCPGLLMQRGGWSSRQRSAYRGLCHTTKPGLHLSVYPVDSSRFLGHNEHYHFSCSVGISFFIARRRAY